MTQDELTNGFSLIVKKHKNPLHMALAKQLVFKLEPKAKWHLHQVPYGRLVVIEAPDNHEIWLTENIDEETGQQEIIVTWDHHDIFKSKEVNIHGKNRIFDFECR